MAINYAKIFYFAEYVNAMRGWGRGLRNAVAGWYVERKAGDLAHQAVKYQQRDGWSHGDLLRLAHPKAPSPQHDAVFRWMLTGADSLGEREVKRKVRGEDRIAKYAAGGELPKLIGAFERVKRTTNVIEVVKLIGEFDLPREAIPTQWLNEVVKRIEGIPMGGTDCALLNRRARGSTVATHPFADVAQQRQVLAHGHSAAREAHWLHASALAIGPEVEGAEPSRATIASLHNQECAGL